MSPWSNGTAWNRRSTSGLVSASASNRFAANCGISSVIISGGGVLARGMRPKYSPASCNAFPESKSPTSATVRLFGA